MAKAVHLYFDLHSILWYNFILKSNSFQKKKILSSVGEEIGKKFSVVRFFPSSLWSQWSAQTCPILQSIWILRKTVCSDKICLYLSLQSQNHRMVGVGRDLQRSASPTPPPAKDRTSLSRPGCSKLYPTWPWTLPVMGHPQLLWATCASVSSLSS